jgi:hypothetical protein
MGAGARSRVVVVVVTKVRLVTVPAIVVVEVCQVVAGIEVVLIL